MERSYVSKKACRDEDFTIYLLTRAAKIYKPCFSGVKPRARVRVPGTPAHHVIFCIRCQLDAVRGKIDPINSNKGLVCIPG